MSQNLFLKIEIIIDGKRPGSSNSIGLPLILLLGFTRSSIKHPCLSQHLRYHCNCWTMRFTWHYCLHWSLNFSYSHLSLSAPINIGNFTFYLIDGTCSIFCLQNPKGPNSYASFLLIVIQGTAICLSL